MAFRTDSIELGSNADLVLDVEQESDGVLIAPSGTPTITITDPHGTDVVSGATMDTEDTGRYIYNFQTTVGTHIRGTYKAVAVLEVATGRTERKRLDFTVN